MAGKRKKRLKKWLKQRAADRWNLITLAEAVYEPGDDAASLKKKMTAAIKEDESRIDWDRLFEILEWLIPLLIKLFA